jgi:ADP-ribosylglycohydrolase
MLGSIAGDIIGSRFEGFPMKSTEFELFHERSSYTDDTVLTVAVADVLLHGADYGEVFRRYGRAYPGRGYGSTFSQWLAHDAAVAYYSWGNGSAMRVSPVGFAFDSVEAVLREAERSAVVTHNHPEGIKGAQAVALSIYLARSGAGKQEIRTEVTRRFGYDLDRTLDAIRPAYGFDVSCQGSVPEAIIAFLESRSVEDAIRKAVSLGGDSDTMACIAGGIAQAHYRAVPAEIAGCVRERLPAAFLDVIDQFCVRFGLA